MQNKINFGGWPNCVRLYNDEIELILTTDIGPRIIRAGFIGKQNFFYLSPEDLGRTGGNDWRIFGGHRLWLAPEAIPRSYYPDNLPVKYSYDGHTLKLTQQREVSTGIVKEMEVTVSPGKNEVAVLHRLKNQSKFTIELSIWALSALAAGGRAIIPQEPFGEGNSYLLPARPLALWPYTKMNDPRWLWGEKYIQATQDPVFNSEQKIGVLNKQGWTAYYLNKEILIKKFAFEPSAIYPDYGCNNEIYINENFLEIETLGPLTKLSPQKSIEHTEHWFFENVDANESEGSISKNILPLVEAFIPQE